MTAVEIEFAYRKVISYAAAYNRRAFISALSVRNGGGSAIADVTVEVRLKAAGQQIMSPWSRQIGALGPVPTTWSTSDFDKARLDDAKIRDFHDQLWATYVVTVSQGDVELSTESFDVSILSPEQWIATEPFKDSEAELAAFVQPNHPLLTPILKSAGEYLERWGRKPSLSGYQTVQSDGRAHVDAMVAAVYESVRDIGLGYINPPPSWDAQDAVGGLSQKVRTSGQVLGDGLGTCLDTATLMAALLENIGLRPVVVIVPGHAFAGYWRSEESLTGEPVIPVREAMNFVQSGELVVFETTTLCGGEHSASFEIALRVGASNLESGLGPDAQAISHVIDIVRVRTHEGVRPIPARVVRPDGTVEVIEYRPQDFTINLLNKTLRDQGASTASALSSRDAPARVNAWLDSLLDLTLRNPLINYRFPRGSSSSLMVPSNALGTVEDLLQSGVKLRLERAPTNGQGDYARLTARRTVPADLADQAERWLVAEQVVVTSEPEQTFLTRMRRIASIARALIAENGTNSLHLAIGMVVWTPEGKAEVSSPLILIPVHIRTSNRSRTFHLEIDSASPVTPNFSLAEKLKRDAGLELPKLIEPELDDAGVDINGLIAYVRSAFTAASLHDFRVDESCTIGFFDFSTYRLWRDMQDHWPTFTQKPLVSHLVHTPYDEFVDPSLAARKVPDEEGEDADSPEADAEAEPLDDFAAALPVESDGSQALAVRRALNGETYVLQGPPGTGKSQTITNVLAQALQSGKRVLFIAEKPTALGVVRDRLAKVGLQSFGLNLHSRGMRPAEVRQQLLDALDAVAHPDRAGFDAAKSDLDRSIPPLARYPERLHRAGSLGDSAYSARNKLLAMADGPALPVSLRFVNEATREVVTALQHALRDIADAGPSAGTAAVNPWSLGTLVPEDLTSERRNELRVTVEQFAQHWRWPTAQSHAAQFLRAAATWPELADLAELAGGPLVSLATVDGASTAEATVAREYITSNVERFGPAGYNVPLDARVMTASVDELRQAASAAGSSFFIGRKKKVAAVADRVRSYLAPGAVVGAGGIHGTLDTIAQAQASAKDFRDYCARVPGLNITPDWNVFDDESRAQLLAYLAAIDRSIRLVGDTKSPERTRLRSLVAEATEDEVRSLAGLGVLARQLSEQLGANEDSIALWMAGAGPSAAIDRSLEAWISDSTDRDFLSLQRWCRFATLLAPLRAAGLNEAADKICTGQVAFAEAERALERGLYAAVLDQQIELQDLHAFDGAQHGAQVRVYATASGRLRELSPGILAQDMLDARSFDASTGVGAIGELRRELSKSRATKPIRRLLHDHWHVISRLTPCVLAVPDAVVRYLDADLEAFDLVVFDEASQIKVPHAIGSLGRARAAVVVGDSRQMPPTSIAESSATSADDDDEEAVVDEESILSECVQARVPGLMLGWHYRSEDESLIAFSNAKYYDGRLNSLPSPSSDMSRKGLTFVRVNGQFMHRGSGAPSAELGTNRAEAETIVAEITRRLNHPDLRGHSIGVVTFNKPQMTLVKDLLAVSEDEAVQEALGDGQDSVTDRENVEVWNLETVQGQERDVILFSIAFSKNASGRVPLNFGPLNRVGGERRLNVAVTRARRQVVVFCSFEPEDLKVEGSGSQGLVDLHGYLTLAKNGPESSGAISSHEIRPPDRHRDEILRRLEGAGLRVAPDVGLSDFKVDIAVSTLERPDWLVGVLLDGEAWKARPTVGDRDALPPQLLERRMGWPAVTRVWTPDWLRNPDGEVERIVELVNEAAAGRRLPTNSPTVDASPASEPADPVAGEVTGTALRVAPTTPPTVATPPLASATSGSDEAASLWTPWKVALRGPDYALEQLHDPATRVHLVKLAQEIVATEGPALRSRVAKLVAQAHGLQRVSSKRTADIGSVVSAGFTSDNDGFLFLASAPSATYTDWRRSRSGDGRVIEEISLAETSNAMRHVATLGYGMQPDELVRATAEAFGVGRVTTGIRERLDKAIDAGLRRRVLAEQNGYIVAGPGPV